MVKTSMTMRDYIEEAPGVARVNLSRWNELTQPAADLCAVLPGSLPRNIWLIASGSSHNAACIARPFMESCLGSNVRLHVVTPFTFVHYEHDVHIDDLALVISQSGFSTNALEALRSLGRPAVCVTGNVAADAADHADTIIDYGVGEEEVGYVTKGVTTLALFLMLVAVRLSGKTERLAELVHALDAADAVRKSSYDFVDAHFKALTSMSSCYCCAAGGTMGVAFEGALKIGETVHVPSVAYEVEEYIHGPNLQLTPNHTVFFFDANDDASARMAQIYRATREVTDRGFLVTGNTAFAEDGNALVLPAKLIPTSDTAGLAYLPFVQLVSFLVSDALGSTKQHPLLRRFKAIAASKTEHWVNLDGDE